MSATISQCEAALDLLLGVLSLQREGTENTQELKFFETTEIISMYSVTVWPRERRRRRSVLMSAMVRAVRRNRQ